MVRGFLSGLIWGGLLVGLALAVLSLSMPMGSNAPVQPVVMVEPQAPVDTAATTATPATENQMVAPSVEASPVMQDPTGGIRPAAGSAEANLGQPTEQASSVSVAGGDTSMAAAGSMASTPSAPQAETELSISTDPAQPMAPAEQNVSMAQDDQGAMTMPELSDEEAAALFAEAMAAAKDAEMAPEAEAPSDDGGSTMAMNTGPEMSGTAGFGARETGVVTDRLPNAGAAMAISGPLAMNAEPFLNPDNQPLMAIVLIDTGEFDIGAQALSSFPYPLTFAVDPLREDAIEVTQSYRDAGFEVLAISNLPETSDPSLAGIILPPSLDSLPGVVGMLEGTEGGLQGNMALSEAVLGVVETSGYGLVLRAKGLNAAQQQAEGRQLPVATVFRDFDAEGQEATVIRRFLDQAAFKSRQQGGVIMVGRVRPATISALLLWGLQDRASSVALAPISAVLLR